MKYNRRVSLNAMFENNQMARKTVGAITQWVN
jgi:hypothetical protein